MKGQRTMQQPGSTTMAGFDPAATVAPVRRRLGAGLAVRWLLRGCAAAALTVAVLVAIGHVVPWPDGDPLGGATRWAAALAAAILAVAILLALRGWPSVEAAVRHADLALDLKDRLTTAHEFAGREGELVELQRQEARERLHEVDLRRAVRFRLPGREIAAAALATLIAVGAALAPDPQASAQSDRARQQAVAHHAAVRTAASLRAIQQRAAQLAKQQPASARRLSTRQIEDLLRQLQSQLLKARTPAQALKALAGAQQQLRQLETQSAQAQRQLAALAQALANSPAQQLARALASGDPAATQRAMGALQKSLAGMSRSRRQALARALEQAANRAQGRVGEQLRQAAQSLAHDDVNAARQSLGAAAQQLAAAQRQAQAGPPSMQALSDIQEIKQGVANGVTQSSPAPGAAKSAGTGRQGSAAGAGRGKPGSSQSGSSAGSRGRHGSGRAGGQPSSGSGNGKATGAGQVPGGAGAQAPGSGQAGAGATGTGSGGHGSGGGHSGAGAGSAGRYRNVFLPGQRHGGPSTTTTGPLGAAVPVQSQAFRQVLPGYAGAAESSLGRTALPPALQAAVKRYFQSLEQS